MVTIAGRSIAEARLRFFELYIVLAFAAAWFILERVAKRYDKPGGSADEKQDDQAAIAQRNQNDPRKP